MSWLNQDPHLEESEEPGVDRTLWQLLSALCRRLTRLLDAEVSG